MGVLDLDPGRVARGLGLTAVALTVCSAVVAGLQLWTGSTAEALHDLDQLFDVDREQNAPTFFATVLLLLAAAVLAVIARAERRARRPYHRHWTVLAVLFTGLSFDEFVGLHEQLIDPIRSATDLPGPFEYGWVLPGMVFVAAVSIGFARFVIRLPPPYRALFVTSALVYVGGALGTELISGEVAVRWGEASARYVAVSTVQELLEMQGVVLFVYTLLRYLGEHWPGAGVRVAAGPSV